MNYLTNQDKQNMTTGTLKTPDNQTIYYDHYRNGFDKVIVLAHGFFNSRRAVLFKEMAEGFGEGYDVIVMDFRGHGQSSGLFYWTSKEYMDLQAVIDYAHQEYKRIGVVGFSLGAAISLITATKTDLIDSLISVSAPVRVSKIDFCFWELSVQRDVMYNITGNGRIGKGIRPGPFWVKKERPIDIVKKIKTPTLYIHGEKDWLIHPWHTEQLFDKAQGQKELAIIQKGPHAEYLILTHKDETMQIMKDWFIRTL